MKWKDLEGKTIVSVVPEQSPASAYRDAIEQEDCWTFSVALTFSDGITAVIEGLQHDEVGGIDLTERVSGV